MTEKGTGSRADAWAAALLGLVAGAVALGVGQLVAGLVSPKAAPVIAVGDATVDHTPQAVKDWAIRTFGAADKIVLIGGIMVVLALVAAGLGLLARTRPGWAGAGLLAFGALGAAAAATRPDAAPLDVLPSLLGAAAGAWSLRLLTHRTWPDGFAAPHHDEPPPAPDGTETRPAGVRMAEPLADVRTEDRPAEVRPAEVRPVVMRAGGEPARFDRRGLLTGVAAGVVVAGVGGLAGRALGGRLDVGTARAEVALPRPAKALPPIPAGADLRLRDLGPFVTPNRDFYRVDTALILPQVDPKTWKLKIHGMVDRPVEITFDQLVRRPLTEADVTLTCVSNDVGGQYVGNARWLGASLSALLREAGLRSGADMLLSTSSDGWTSGTPVDVVMDGRDALLAVGMNGEALPLSHGFPVRQVVPGLYGYVSATKWITEIKVTRYDRDEAYWTERGWAAKGPIKTQSRIDLPRGGSTVPPGPTPIAGVAWAQHKGIDAVEVRVDKGPWRQARLADVPGIDTWRQWVLDGWTATPGDHTIEVRATDATGYTQTPDYAPVIPDGAAGWHSILITVK
ncbi:oxidoreductase [Sphaerisporangium krabiense]|uniref:DMSO/TMAO reductase YedYZ molybdopterin-dependent catalytic subunit n=1 Tax=Sphaerisporangium krabiense TaxID=763782 RepID=A0A7W8YZ05_9ACTN|nr:molybdopterin-dependent oxidoreductase [Sphaerisporangium krabiense]MBB5624371.1 DMSO/TMAO reductase YedYZ molybdopterin-dependent catalytic subunit [Sphaerisporangium krabiense]GII61675.1 oxidoreductase [Sphaerisporangium krabiense]